MENLNAEQIKRALESCANRSCGVDCPYYDAEICTLEIMRDALALINSQEQRIKELTEESEAWQKELVRQKEIADKHYYDLACEVEDLRSENERLRAELEQRPPKLIITKLPKKGE